MQPVNPPQTSSTPVTAPSVCVLNIAPEYLSAYHDGLLSPAETETLRAHIPECTACQATLQGFTTIAQALQQQSVPALTAQTLNGITARQGKIVQRRRQVRRMLLAGGGTLVIIIVGLYALFAFRGRTNTASALPLPFPGYSQAIPSPVTDSTTGLLNFIYDAQSAGSINYAAIKNAQLFVWRQGSRQTFTTLLGTSQNDVTLSGPNTLWGITWTPDRTRLLVTANTDTAHAGWIVYLDSNEVSRLGDTETFLASACLGRADGTTPCLWVQDRQIFYPTNPQPTATVFHCYDVQNHRSVPTAVDATAIQYEPLVRGPYLFYTPYGTNELHRYDTVSGQDTLLQALPGQTTINQRPEGGWSLNSDGTQLLYASATPVDSFCVQPVSCNTFVLRLDATNPDKTSHQNAFSVNLDGRIQDVALSPNGQHIFALISSTQGLIMVERTLNPDLANNKSYFADDNEQRIDGPGITHFFGWTVDGGVILVQDDNNGREQSQSTTLWIENSNQGLSLHRVIMIQNGLVVFAPQVER